MKLLRHLTPAGPACAALQPDGTALAITGDLLGDYTVTAHTVALGPLLAPVMPPNIIGIGLNYRRHADEGGKAVPKHPLWFMKNTAALQNPGAPIILPRMGRSEKVDYEGELAVVIGRTCRNATRATALDHVLGYTAANDVSARDWQFDLGSGQFCHGKSFDTFCPLGPVIVTRDEIPDPQALTLTTHVNGELRQTGQTSDMVFSIIDIIVFLSASRTLLPGTVILTGSPHGVGYARTPPVWLAAGDVVDIAITGIGRLSNPVEDESA